MMLPDDNIMHPESAGITETIMTDPSGQRALILDSYGDDPRLDFQACFNMQPESLLDIIADGLPPKTQVVSYLDPERRNARMFLTSSLGDQDVFFADDIIFSNSYSWPNIYIHGLNMANISNMELKYHGIGHAFVSNLIQAACKGGFNSVSLKAQNPVFWTAVGFVMDLYSTDKISEYKRKGLQALEDLADKMPYTLYSSAEDLLLSIPDSKTPDYHQKFDPYLNRKLAALCHPDDGSKVGKHILDLSGSFYAALNLLNEGDMEPIPAMHARAEEKKQKLQDFYAYAEAKLKAA